MTILLVLGTFAATAVLAGLVRRYALTHSVVDVPNERSSHARPTPRGGGLAIVAIALAAVATLAATGQMTPRTALALAGGGLLIALVGWVDDKRDLRASVRIAAHTAAAAWAVAWLGGMPPLTVGTGAVARGTGGALLAIRGIVWGTNLYNFMDGIDGLAAVEAVVVGTTGALLLASRHSSLGLLGLVLAAAAAGFLTWNWPPARLFMGDVGSGFLGFAFAVIGVAGENDGVMPALLWILLLGPFFADATITLLRRMRRGERWYAAHRSHAYQRAVQAGRSHGQVTAAVALLTALCAVLAWGVLRRPGWLVPALAGAAAILSAVYFAVERIHPMETASPESDRSR